MRRMDVGDDSLPADVRDRLAELELELSEGDITQKGFEKKKARLLAPFHAKNGCDNAYPEDGPCDSKAFERTAATSSIAQSPSTRAHRRHQRRLTRDEGRYHSEIRSEAVQQALAEYSDGRKVAPMLVQPKRRRNDRQLRQQHAKQKDATDSSSDEDDSIFGSTGRKSLGRSSQARRSSSSTKAVARNDSNRSIAAAGSSHPHQQPLQPTKNGDASARNMGGAAVEAMLRRVQENQDHYEQLNRRDYGEYMQPRMRNNGEQTAAMKRTSRQDYRNSRVVVTENDAIRISPHREEVFTGGDDALLEKDAGEADYANMTTTAAAQIGDDLPGARRFGFGDQRQEYQNAILPFRPTRVSLKIQNVVNDLQKPKNKPLQEYYNDDDAELEAMAKLRDPAAPRPEGTTMNPVRGESCPTNSATNSAGAASMTSTLPKIVDGALHRFGTTSAKVVAAMLLDQKAKPTTPLTYGKLLSRSNKLAHMLLNKTVGSAKVPMCRTGDRVALVYPNTQPLHFLVAFHGCLLAGVVPVPVEMPTSKRDAGISQLGFLLGNCGCKVALTSETCYKGIPKKAATSTSTGSAPSGSSSLSGSSTECVDFRGWPKLYWVITDSLDKPSRDWTAPPRVADDTVAYIEYSTDRDGAVKGVCVSRKSMLAHCRAISAAMEYREGETMVCVVDFKREVGLWHAVLAAVFNGMRVIFVPYSLMKMNPASWLQMVSKYSATTALVKSRDLHWALLAVGDNKDVSLASLRALLIADGANPWSLSSCDAFVAAFADAAHGLRADAMCPCAGSPETGTISIRRRTNSSTSSSSSSGSASGRGVLSMFALSHCVVRVDQENSLSSLTLQDAGQVISGAVVVVVALDDGANATGASTSRLCQVDEIGEICVSANSTAHAYWALEGQTNHAFRVEPVGENGRPSGALKYVRSGLIGFMGPDGLVFVVARRSSLLNVSDRYHSADDIIATVLAVEPMRFVYRGRICVFSTSVLRDERIVIVAEQKPGTTEDEAFNWMARVLQAIDTIHQVGIYCVALVMANQLPKTPLGGIHVSETRERFKNGELHPCTLMMCPHSCVLNLPKPRERQADVGPAAIFVGNIVQGVRIAGAQGRPVEDEVSYPLLDLLRSRAVSVPEHRLLTLVTAKNSEADSATCSSLLKRAERVAGLLTTERSRLNRGDHVALIIPPSIDLVAAFFGCLAAGLVPVCIQPPSAADLIATLPTVRMAVDISKSVVILSTTSVSKLLKSKEAAHRVDANAWPVILDMEDAPSSWKRKTTAVINSPSSGTVTSSNSLSAKSDVCYLDFAMSSSGQLTGVVMTEAAAVSACKSLKVSCELYPSRHVAICAPPYSGISLVMWCLSSVYSGHHTTLIPPAEVEAQPSLLLTTLSNGCIRDAFTTHATMRCCVEQLGSTVVTLKDRGCVLSSLRTFVAIAEERPRNGLMGAFCRLFAPLGLNPRAVSASFSARVNPAICMQGASGPETSTVYVDAKALRNDRITLVGKGAPHSIALTESGKLLPGVKVAIANPDTRGQCADTHLGEIWVSCAHNASSAFYAFGTDDSQFASDVFNARLATGDTQTRWARTGYLGFLRQTQSITEHGELHDAVFVVGKLQDSLLLRGMRYWPVDIETTVCKSHRNVGDSCVFTWNHLVVIAAECIGTENEALDVVPAITSAVLEDHHLIVGVIVVVDPGSIRYDSAGDKQRNILREAFLHDRLDPIYVAYNM